ncbi:hypothetical protein Sjap_019890 [Stephania japonica]|uniref:Receptor-like serine/threonine-protein kinase n=1 Tax=Stephania japonica TaxID=461633 RepID=A0AAP0EZM4_9MAGN
MKTNSTPLLTSFLVALFLSNLSFAPCHSIGTSTSAADTMFAGQFLTANQTLVSKDGKFELGFFTPGNSQNHYMGIWFKQVAAVQKKKTIVWVANRDKPITPTDFSSSEFKLLENGQLVLLISAKSNYSSKVSVWSTDSTISKAMNDSSAKVVLGYDGNLVVTSSSNGNIIWQSFDHPAHAYLPGAKFGYNNHTKKGNKLTAWKNSEDPSEGMYSLELGLDERIDFTWNHSLKYYTSGVWNGRYFSNFPEMQVGFGMASSLEYKSYENGMYFTYSLLNKALPFYVFMDTSGQLKTAVWQANTQDWTVIWTKPMPLCQVYGVCGAFSFCSKNNLDISICQCLPGFEQHYPKDWGLLDHSGGCLRRDSLQCGDKDSFSKMPNVIVSRISPSANALAMDNAKKCELACLQNCSCSAYAYDTTSSSSGNSIQCLLWYGNLLNIEQLDNKGNGLYIRLAPLHDQLGSRMKPSTKWTLVGVALSGTTILLGITFHFLRKRWIKKFTKSRKLEEGYAFLTAFRYKDLKIATKNFTDKLGSGGFGSVFKGTLPNSTAIAVKRLEGVSQDLKQFPKRGRKTMLVYDLMPNGSLDKHLFNQNNSRILNWQQRYQIAKGTARGLAYLHEECIDRIIHCDIKPENVLLDADFSPKVADFGLAKLLGREFSRVLTTVRGTVGYLAPEWTSGVPITVKADVYSYGMMLFEIISGRRNLKRTKDGKVWFFPTWAARKVVSEGQPVLLILDSRLEGNADNEELNRAFRVACWCIQEEEIQRPSMGQVVQILEGLLEVNPPPIQRYLQEMVENEETTNFFSE